MGFAGGGSGSDLAAACCHFNPFHTAQRVRNYRRFRSLLKQSGVRLLTVELAFGDDPFELPDGPDAVRVRGGDIMWQKERLLQLGGERLLDEGCRKLVFLDADVIFENNDWPVLVSRALDRWPVVQCFSRATRKYTDTVRLQDSSVKAFLESGALLRGAKGIAWAMTADVFAKAGLFQHCIVGGGDAALCCAALGLAHGEDAWERSLRHLGFIRHAGAALLARYRNWAGMFHEAARGNCGFVDQAVLTMSCGTYAGRSYQERHHLLADFDPSREVAIQASGAFCWTPAGRARQPGVERYLRSREASDVLA